MASYQFHFIGPDDARPLVDFRDCADDGAAAREAVAQLQQHGSVLGVEVWEEARLILRLERRPEDVMPVGGGLHGRIAPIA